MRILKGGAAYMPWNLDSNLPIYPQIMERITLDIISGTYLPGSKLPSVRDLAQDAGVNPNTMQKALSELERTGLLYSQRTSGRFITEDLTMIEQTKNTLASEQVKERQNCPGSDYLFSDARKDHWSSWA